MKVFYEDNDYDIILNFDDENPITCTFEVTCDRMDLVTIVQDGVTANKFNIAIGTISSDRILVKFSFIITNNNGHSNPTDEYIILRKNFTNDIKYYTKVEIGDKFVYESDYEDEDVLNKILNVDGEESGLDADFLDGYDSSEDSSASTIPTTNVEGKINNGWLYHSPIINSIIWDDDVHTINRSYVMVVDACDTKGLDLIYGLVCSDPQGADPPVTITQRLFPDTNVFDIIYGDYDHHTNVTYSLTITNTDGVVKTMDFVKTIIDTKIFGNRGIIAGYVSSGTVSIKYITISTNGNASDFGDLSMAGYKNFMALTSNGTNNRGILAGGDAVTCCVDTIDYIDISFIGNATDFGVLNNMVGYPSAASNGINDRGVIAGGYNNSMEFLCVDTIDYITISSIGDAIDFGNLLVAKRNMSATSNDINDRAIFAGGHTSATDDFVDTIEYITISSEGNASNFGNISTVRCDLAATSNRINNRGIIGGGRNLNLIFDNIEYINISSFGATEDFGDLSIARNHLAAASNGVNDKGIFAGGWNFITQTELDTIDYVIISTTGNAIEFGDLGGGLIHGVTGTSNA